LKAQTYTFYTLPHPSCGHAAKFFSISSRNYAFANSHHSYGLALEFSIYCLVCNIE
jgi:hypothetical protein